MKGIFCLDRIFHQYLNYLHLKKEHENEIVSSSENTDIAVLAASDGKSVAVLVTNSKDETVKVRFDLKNMHGKITAIIIDKQRTFEKIPFSTDFEMPPFSVLLLESNADESNTDAVTAEGSSYKFAGLDND